MPSHRMKGRILAGSWIVLLLLYVLPPALLLFSGMNFGVSIVPAAGAKLLVLLLLLPWVALAWATWLWRRNPRA